MSTYSRGFHVCKVIHVYTYFTYNFTTELNYEIQITTLGINLSLQTDPSKNLQDQLNMIGVEGDPNDTELFPLANFNPVCVVDVVRTDHKLSVVAHVPGPAICGHWIHTGPIIDAAPIADHEDVVWPRLLEAGVGQGHA